MISISHKFIADYRKTGFIGQKLWQLNLRIYPYCCEPWTYFSPFFNAALINNTQGMASGLVRYTPILNQIKWYSMTCMGACTRYKTAGKFATGAKCCQVCSIFIRSDSRLCPCCNYPMGTGPCLRSIKAKWNNVVGQQRKGGQTATITWCIAYELVIACLCCYCCRYGYAAVVIIYSAANKGGLPFNVDFAWDIFLCKKCGA